jgi:hypothetical protein
MTGCDTLTIPKRFSTRNIVTCDTVHINLAALALGASMESDLMHSTVGLGQSGPCDA